MSGGEPSAWRVSLRLRAGERDGRLFEKVTVPDPSCSLAVFLDTVLKDLESQRSIQLPFTEETDLINPRTFKVFNEQMTQELDLSVSMRDHPYIVNSVTTGASPPVLVLQSDIFMSASQVMIEQLVKLRQTTTEEPQIPQRGSSLAAEVMTKEDIVYLTGCKEPDIKRIKRDISSTSLASSQNSSSPHPFLSDEMADRLFDTVSSTSDSVSLQSAGI